MICFPNAKINLGLHVVERLASGYHHIETLFYPIPLCDALEFEIDTEARADSLELYGIEIDSKQADNLVMKALNRMRQVAEIPWLKIALLKRIPSGAGLGGGSSDAASMLQMLNEQFKIGLKREQLQAMALELGADCPFFLHNQPTLASGLGEVFTSVEAPKLSGLQIVLVKANIHIHTGKAYQSLSKVGPHTPKLKEIIEAPLSSWRESLTNDFEEVVFAWHPQLQAIKDKLYQMGALYAAMSGSGSTIYGIFESPVELGETKLFTDCFVWQSTL